MSSARGRFRAPRAPRPPRSRAAAPRGAGPLAELRRLQEGNGSSQFPPGSRLLSNNFGPSRKEGVEGGDRRFEAILESQEPLAIKKKAATEVKKNLFGSSKSRPRPRGGCHTAAGLASSSTKELVTRSKSRHPGTSSSAALLGGAGARNKENLATGLDHQDAPLPWAQDSYLTLPCPSPAWDTAAPTGLPWSRAAKVVALERIRSL